MLLQCIFKSFCYHVSTQAWVKCFYIWRNNVKHLFLLSSFFSFGLALLPIKQVSNVLTAFFSEPDSCSDSACNHRSNCNLPIFLLKKLSHRLLLLPKLKSDTGSSFSQIFDSGSEGKPQNPVGVDSGSGTTFAREKSSITFFRLRLCSCSTL